MNVKMKNRVIFVYPIALPPQAPKPTAAATATAPPFTTTANDVCLNEVYVLFRFV
jgi:hypothetical protein